MAIVARPGARTSMFRSVLLSRCHCTLPTPLFPSFPRLFDLDYDPNTPLKPFGVDLRSPTLRHSRQPFDILANAQVFTNRSPGRIFEVRVMFRGLGA